MSLKSEVTCTMCHRIVLDPVSLPCLCSVICNEHSTGKLCFLKCADCNHEYSIPRDGFRSNKLAKSVIQKELYLTEDEKTLKNEIESLISDLEKIQLDFKEAMSNYEEVCDEKFVEMQQQIESQRDMLKQKIDEIALKLIDQAKQRQHGYKQKLGEIHSKVCKVDVAKIRHTLSEELRNLTGLVTNCVKLREETCAKMSDLQAQIGLFSASLGEMKLNSHTEDDGANVFFVGAFNAKRVYKNMITSSTEGCINILNLETYECLKTFQAHSERINCIETLQNQTFMSGSKDKLVKQWNLEGKCLKTFSGHTDEVTCLATFKDDIVTSGSLNEIKVWDIESGTCLHTLIGHTGWIKSLTSLKDGRLASMCDEDKTIKIWSTSEGTCIHTFTSLSEPVRFLLPSFRIDNVSTEISHHIVTVFEDRYDVVCSESFC